MRLLVAMLCVCSVARAGDRDELLTRGIGAYQAGDYGKAAEAFEALSASGAGTADVYFNLGTAQLRAGRRGAAILAFERALRIDPDDADAAFNLAEAQRGNIDKVVGAREEEPLLERIGARVPGEAVAWIFVGAWLAGILALIGRTLLARARGFLSLVATLGLVAAGLSGALVGAAAWHDANARYAVVVAPVTAVREGPADDFKSTFEIHEGLKVRVVRVDRGYLRIRLPNGVEGWAAQKDVPLI